MVREMTAEEARAIRNELGLTLSDFWGAIGYSISTGHQYETGKTPFPDPARRLVFLHYVLGIPTDPASPEYKDFDFTTAMKRGGAVKTRKARQTIERGLDLLKQGLNELS